MKRSYPSSIIYVARFLIEFCTALCVFPCMNYAGIYFARGVITKKAFHFGMFIVFVMIGGVLFALFAIHCRLCSFSCYISRSRIHGLGNTPFISVLFWVGITTLIFHIIALFTKWLSILLAAIYSVAYFYAGYTFLHSFFIHNWVMLMYFGCFMSASFAFLFEIAFSFFDELEYIPFIVLISLYAICQIVIWYFFKNFRAKAASKLSLEALGNPDASFEEKAAYLDSLGLSRDFTKIEFYMKLALTSGSGLLLDWTAVKYSSTVRQFSRVKPWDVYCFLLSVRNTLIGAPIQLERAST